MRKSFDKSFQDRSKSDKQKKSQEIIIEFFLNLYTIQLKAPPNTSRSFRLKNHRHGNEFTYELKVQHQGKWNSRPMGISPIGGEAGSKSNCFKVIYDEILVVKIPRSPVYDFEKYIEVIRNERKIAYALQPDIPCIVPSISTILKKIPFFFEGMCWTPEEVEGKCIERLRHFPAFQQYLKLGHEFVFFMDISQYSFLIQILNNLFGLNQKIKKEIIKNPELLLKFQMFEERYGIEYTSVWLKTNRIFQEYQIKIHSVLKRYGLDTTVHDYQRRQWFLFFMAGKKIASDDQRFSDIFFNDLNKLISKMTFHHSDVFNEYKSMVRSYVKKENFAQARLKISRIVAGILRLLALLKEKQVSIRDLKPDNIFVTSMLPKDSSEMSHGQKIFLGLIDLETAISIHVPNGKKLRQPLPGGTPSYSTPSNFVQNQVLEKFFQDIPHLLHIQDWHACLCMIYMAVTGELLFNQSKVLLYDFVNKIQRIQDGQADVFTVFEEQSHLFWCSAHDEFSKNHEAKKDLLNDIEVMVSNRVSAMFQSEALKLKKALTLQIENTLNSQQIFKSPQHLKTLLDSSPDMVCRFREKWQKMGQSTRLSSKIYQDIMLFFQKLEDLKIFIMKLEQWIENFKDRPLVISVANLMEFMFHVVFETMYSKQFNKNNNG